MATQKNTPDSHKKICACGCRTFTWTDTATYVPGHDAKHVSALLDDARAIIAANGQISTAETRALVDSIPSPALQNKLRNAIERLGRKRPSSRKPKNHGVWLDVDNTVAKVGRWTYPIQEKWIVATPTGDQPTGKFRRNTKRDGSGRWVEIENASELVEL